MRGIIRYSSYLPHWKLPREEIRTFFGTGGGSGTRSVAGHDEDTTTMAVEALRPLLYKTQPSNSATSQSPKSSDWHSYVGAVDDVYFSTTNPAYLDKTNASAIHCALSLDTHCGSYDLCGGLRSGIGTLKLALTSTSHNPVLVAISDIRNGLPTSSDESLGGDGACGFLIGEESDNNPVLAELLGSYSISDEFLDRWREPSSSTGKTWEERFGEFRYLEIGTQAFDFACKKFELAPEKINRLITTGMHTRAVTALVKKLGVGKEQIENDRSTIVGQCGSAHPAIILCAALEKAKPFETIALLHLADGADVMFFRTTKAVETYRPLKPLDIQINSLEAISYSKFLSWRSMVDLEPPKRPEPSRTSSSAAWRSRHWKYSLDASVDRKTNSVHMPPSRISYDSGSIDDMDLISKSNSRGKIATFTIDRLAYSPSPPIIFAIIDFEDGGRFPVELTDCLPEQVGIGMEVEMTFRKLGTADGINNYFWKGRLVTQNGLTLHS